MDVRGKRVLVFGDSLTHRGGRADPDGVPALPGVARSGSPGDLLASHLLAAGAGAVRINGRVSRSAINLWRSNNGEDGAAVVAAEAAARPDIVIVFLGTNDLGMNATADAAAFGRIAAAFRGAQVWAVGPPAFARADLNAQAAVVVRTLQGVFGAHRVIDLRPLTADIVVPAQGRAGDGVHFATAGAAKTAQRLAAAFAAADNRVDAVTSATPALRAWWPLPVSAAAAAALLVGVAVVVRRRRQLQGLGRAGVAAPAADAALETTAAAVRRELARCGYGGGRCADASRELARRLRAQGHDAVVVSGKFLVEGRPSPHHWVEVGDTIVDATVDQFQIGFDEPLPQVLVAPRAAWPQYLRGPTSEPRTLFDPHTVPAHDRSVLATELDDAAVRAVKAGAGPMEYMGAGAEGIVFCDGDTAYKVGRPGRGSLKNEAAFLKKAGQIPAIKQHIAKFIRFDAANNVIVRECVRQRGMRHGQPRRVADAEAWDLADRIQAVMQPYGFRAPERKGNSFVYVSGRGPVLVDAGFALRHGQELVKEALDVVNGRAANTLDVRRDLIFALEHERDETIPPKVADKLIARLDAMRTAKAPLGTPAVTVKTTQPWAEYGDDMDVHEWVVEDEAAIDGVELRSRHNPKHYALAHRATTGGRWQVTWFDELGPGGDVRRPTLVEALTEGASSNEFDVERVHTKAERKLAGAGDAPRQKGKPGRIARECVECGNATDRICVYCKSPLCVECSFTGECYRCVQARRKGVPAKLAGAGDAPCQKYQRAAARVDGRTVLDDVPNTGSIDSSLNNYEVLPGIREVPFTAFDQLDPGPPRYYHSTSEAKRTKQLAAQIRESAEISPLIVVEDAEGPYILEGGHRFDALRELGAQAFPALVVLDLDSLATKP